ncbi:hypothetical protein [uncultured Gilvimarinus sp.]|uniref:hypothetical protein n=1 Tax=uncultured Gilvimarinus sp. TaxID=1689143 RepID=UPI0030D7DF47
MSSKQTYRPRDNSHIHEVGDNRGLRKIYLNGGLIDWAFYADTRKGFVGYYPAPVRLNKRRGDRALSRRKRGKVVIKWHRTT